jgi:phosphoglycerol transferase MdoB-like AlkP superfamily enzyme
MIIENLCKWLYETSLAVMIRENESLFPWIESVHVIAITLVLGSIAIVDLRLIGWASLDRCVKRVAEQTLPITWIMFVLAAASGIVLFISNALAYANNLYFQAKLVLLLLAGLNMLVFQYGIYQSVEKWGQSRRPPSAARMAGALSLTFWITIVVFGRWIGFTLAPTIPT